ncbi:MAG: hypothetical protein CMJ18_18800 [Phycisphaeraceae bacterium]|nr:hypothetical protein [Phycisphaeraceae bacterium]
MDWMQGPMLHQSYPGRVNLCVDLGASHPVDEVGIRFLGGTPWDLTAGIDLPGWIEVFVADERRGPYRKIATYSRFTPGDDERHGVPRPAGQPLVFGFRFPRLGARGRFIGIRFYANSYVATDELYVLRGGTGDVSGEPSDFSVSEVQMFFHKPAVHVSPDIATPLPIGCVGVRSEKPKSLVVALTVPKGVRILQGGLYAQSVGEATVTEDAQGITYTWRFDTTLKLPRKGSQTGSDKAFARLYWIGQPDEGAPQALRHQVMWGDYRSPVIETPIVVHEIPEPKISPRRLRTSLGWWRFQDTPLWPDWKKAFRHVGINTVCGFPKQYIVDDAKTLQRVQAFLTEAREFGFHVEMIDNPLRRLWIKGARHNRAGQGRPEHREILCQFEGGRTGTRLCPSYRGRFFREETARLGRAVALFRPDAITMDIEVWSDQCADPPKCTRCRARKQEQRIASWDEWKKRQGIEIWSALYEACGSAAAESALATPDIGVFEWTTGEVFHTVFPIDELYPERLHNLQPRFYAPFGPHHLRVIGRHLRAQRRRIDRNDLKPWLGTGDFGPFTGETFHYALLECFLNGARGFLLYSNRTLDADLLAGYARATRTIAPFENIVVDGEPIDVTVEGMGRASAMKLDSQMLLLVEDYDREVDEVRLRLNVADEVVVHDLDDGAKVGVLGPGKAVLLTVPVHDVPARLLHIGPSDSQESEGQF